ncbi:MAG: hypothetical protein ABSA79_05370 [Candidatus Bathyarchaeia archaeon]|jgi:hypothetical protein
MELLRFAEKYGNGTPKDYIETSTLQTVRGDLDADTLIPNQCLADKFSLKPIYEELLGSY